MAHGCSCEQAHFDKYNVAAGREGAGGSRVAPQTLPFRGRAPCRFDCWCWFGCVRHENVASLLQQLFYFGPFWSCLPSIQSK